MTALQYGAIIFYLNFIAGTLVLINFKLERLNKRNGEK